MTTLKYIRPFCRFVNCSSTLTSQRLIHIERRKDHVRLIDKNDTMDFHYIWLRHNCPTIG
ncbi:unnamed protein product, partial [Rotaria magnacalcarata]